MNQQYIWRRKNEAHTKKNILPKMKDGSGSVMLWGCFGFSSSGNQQHMEAKMDPIDYQEIQSNNIMSSVIRPSSKTVIPSIPQSPPRLGFRRYLAMQHIDSRS